MRDKVSKPSPLVIAPSVTINYDPAPLIAHFEFCNGKFLRGYEFHPGDEKKSTHDPNQLGTKRAVLVVVNSRAGAGRAFSCKPGKAPAHPLQLPEPAWDERQCRRAGDVWEMS